MKTTNNFIDHVKHGSFIIILNKILYSTKASCDWDLFEKIISTAFKINKIDTTVYLNKLPVLGSHTQPDSEVIPEVISEVIPEVIPEIIDIVIDEVIKQEIIDPVEIKPNKEIEVSIEKDMFEQSLDKIMKERQQLEEQIKKEISQTKNACQINLKTEKIIVEEKLSLKQIPTYKPF